MREPVRIAAVVRAVAYALAVLVDVDPEAFALAVVPAVEAITAVWTRRRVTPWPG